MSEQEPNNCQLETESIRRELEQREHEIELLKETSFELSREFDLPTLYRKIAERARNLIDARTLLIPILDLECTEYTYIAGDGEHVEEIIGESLPIDYGVCGWVWRNKRPWWHGMLDELEDEEETVTEDPATNVIMVPLIGKEHFLGGISGINKNGDGNFTQRDLDILTLFANQVALTIENAQLYENLRQLNADLEKRVDQRTQELQNLNEEMKSFSYAVSHDLRAPLRSINGFATILMEDNLEQLDEDGQDALQRIQRSAGNMQQLIEGLLTLSRLSREPMSCTHFDMADLTREILAEIQQQHDKSIRLEAPDAAETFGDRKLLSSVLYNLLGNAAKFSSTREEPHIELRVENNEEGQTVYAIRDNGIGFDEAYADKLFKAFQRLHSPADYEGSGIGLATAAQIIRRHNGHIWAESGDGEGASFYFTLGDSGADPCQ